MKTVLLVEDSPDDALMMQNACRSAEIPHVLVHLLDGVEAIDYLAAACDDPDPAAHRAVDLVFLDIKLPRKDGHEVLAWIRAQPAFRKLARHHAHQFRRPQ